MSATVAVSQGKFGAPRLRNRAASWTFSKQGQAERAEFVADRNVDVEKLFTHRWKLERAEEAYKLFDTQTTGKAVILPS